MKETPTVVDGYNMIGACTISLIKNQDRLEDARGVITPIIQLFKIRRLKIYCCIWYASGSGIFKAIVNISYKVIFTER